jgi:hypothetical protein
MVEMADEDHVLRPHVGEVPRQKPVQDYTDRVDVAGDLHGLVVAPDLFRAHVMGGA